MVLGGVAYTLLQLKINSYVGGAAFYGYGVHILGNLAANGRQSVTAT